MNADQLFVFVTLGACLVLFMGGWVRYDVVAVSALLAVTIFGIVPAREAFMGFGHPAVITVAAVLVLSRGLRNSGLVDAVAAPLLKVGDRPLAERLGLTGISAVCSAFMNNVGALAVLMPVAIQMSRKSGRSASTLLMPLAFASLLGGLVTLIGTPPNIIVATFRARDSQPFGMFDFLPVGGPVAIAGVLFISFIGWRLIPKRHSAAPPEELFNIEDYITELRVTEGSKLVDGYVKDLDELSQSGAMAVGLIRNGRCISVPSPYERLREGDVLLVEADHDAIESLIRKGGMKLVTDDDSGERLLKSSDVRTAEMIVGTDSALVGRTARQMNLRWGLGMNVLAVARYGRSAHTRLGEIRFQPGDILLLQGSEASIGQSAGELGLLPLAARGLRIGKPRKMLLTSGLFIASIVAAATGMLPIHLAFMAAVVLVVITGQVSLRELYESVDWSVIVLLAAMIPIGSAMETTGGSQWIADGLLAATQSAAPWIALTAVLLVTMFLSDLMNNAATAVLMCPIAARLADGLGASADPFLMAVAVGASCAFLTPIGHQSNTLVMVPGGYRFGDYWRLGLPLELVIAAVAVPLLVIAWPLQ